MTTAHLTHLCLIPLRLNVTLVDDLDSLVLLCIVDNLVYTSESTLSSATAVRCMDQGLG